MSVSVDFRRLPLLPMSLIRFLLAVRVVSILLRTRRLRRLLICRECSCFNPCSFLGTVTRVQDDKVTFLQSLANLRLCSVVAAKCDRLQMHDIVPYNRDHGPRGTCDNCIAWDYDGRRGADIVEGGRHVRSGKQHAVLVFHLDFGQQRAAGGVDRFAVRTTFPWNTRPGTESNRRFTVWPITTDCTLLSGTVTNTLRLSTRATRNISPP